MSVLSLRLPPPQLRGTIVRVCMPICRHPHQQLLLVNGVSRLGQWSGDG